MTNPITGIFKKISRAWHTYRYYRDMPLRLEFVLTDFCNLNCKGCSHFSPVAPREFADIEQMRRVMARLGRVCGNDVKAAYLIGGETLLYPRLVEAMEALRQAFPTQELYIFTNGLMLPKMSDEFWETARRLDIIISITRYPIKFDYDVVEQLCRDRGVRLDVFADRSNDGTFFRLPLDPEKRQNGRVSHFKCYQRGCVSVVGDRIYPCSISACVGHLNKAFGTRFEHVDGDWLNVDDVTDAKQILRLRDRPVPFCKYCKPTTVTHYGPSRRDVSEWVDEK